MIHGNMYPTLSHETKQKNWQRGIDKTDAQKEKECMRFQPIASQKMTQTYQISSTVVERIWYTDTPIKHYQFTPFMHDIFINVKCSTTYTVNCLRATAI